MTLKGKKKALRNIIACLIAVILIGGVTSIVYSLGTASIKVTYVGQDREETWDTSDEFTKEWFTNLKTGEINFVVNLKEYYDIISKQKEILGEEPFKITATVNNEELSGITITEIREITEGGEEKFNGKYNVAIKLPESEKDYSLKIKLIVEKENAWDIPQTEKIFNIERDTVSPVVNISGINNNERYNEKNLIISVDELNILTTDLTVKTYTLNNGREEVKVYTGEESVELNFNKDNKYKVVAYAKDKSGNSSQEESVTFDINVSSPDVSINDIEVKDIYNKRTLNIKINDANKIDFDKSTYTITKAKSMVDKGRFDKKDEFNGEKEIQLPEDGVYQINIKAVDALGKETNVDREIIVDTVKPIITLSGINKEYVTEKDNRELTITIEEDNILTATNSIIVTKDDEPYRDGEWNLDISNGVGTLKYTFDEEGQYDITVNSKDLAENEAETKTLSFKVDLDEPKISIKNSGKELVNNSYLGEDLSKDISVVITESNIRNATIEVKYNGEEYNEKLEFKKSKKQLSLTHTFRREGIYEMKISASDAVGRVVEKVITFTVDNTRPEVTISEKLEEGLKDIIEGFNYDRDINLVIESKDVNQGENNVTVQTKLFNGNKVNVNLNDFEEVNIVDGVGIVTLNDILSDVKFADDLEIGSNGKYTIEVTSVDKANNKTTKEISFIIDKINPQITIEDVNRYVKDAPVVKVTVEEENFDKDGYEVTVEVNKKNEDKDGKDTSFDLDFNQDNRKVTNEYKADNFTANGLYEITVKAKDKAGNKAETKLTFTKDSNPPEITLSGISEGDHYNTDKTLTVVTSDYNHKINEVHIKGTFEGKSIFDTEELVLDNFTAEGNERNFEYTFTEEANYEVKVISEDQSGNKVEENITFTIDKTPSVITINNFDKLNNSYNQTGQAVSIKVIEENFNTNDVKVSYTKELATENGYDPVSEPIQLDFDSIEKDCTHVFSGSNFDEEAIYVLTVTATDKAGNNAESKSVKFTTDNIPPALKVLYDGIEKSDDELSAKGVHEYQRKNVKITSYDVNQDINTIEITRDGKPYELKDARYEIYLEEENKIIYSMSLNGRNGEFEYLFTEEGDYKVTAYSKDLSGRESKREFNFTIDTTAPVITINDFNSLDDTFNNPGKNVTVNVNEHNFTYNTVNVTINKELEDGSVIVISTDDSLNPDEKIEFENLSEITSHTYEKFADDAKYTMTITAKDLAGNVAVKENLELTITTDTTKPEVQITGVEDAKHYKDTMNVTISSYDVNHKTNDVTVTKDGKSFLNTKLPEGVRSASISLDFPEEGEYKVTIFSKDKAGNENTTSKTFTIDKTKPVITLMFSGEDRVIKNGEYINKIFTPYFKLDEAEDTIDVVKLNNGSNIAGAIPMSSTEMVYNYFVQASDKAGNTEELTITYTVDVTNPEVKVTGIVNGFFNEDMKPEYTITDTNLDKAKTYALMNNKPFESGTLIEEQNYYNFKLLGTDLASNATERNIIFAIDKDKPVIKFLEAMSGQYFTEDFIPNFIIEDLTDYTIVSMTLDGEDYELGDMITEEGKHVLYIEVKDKAENIESISVEFILDKTPPKFIVNGIKNKGVYFEAVNAEITLENPLDKITGITVNGELAQGDIKEENGQQVIRLNFNEIKEYEVVLNAVDDAGNKTEEVINFEITHKNIFTAIYKNKTIFYPTVIIIAAIVAFIGAKALNKDKKVEDNSGESEE